MKNRRCFSIVSVCLFALCFHLTVASQTNNKALPNNQVQDEKSAVAELRDLYFKRDYESGWQRGQKLTGQFPGNMELQAWFISNTARNEMSAEAVKLAEKLVENNKENGWAQFALAQAYIRNGQDKQALAAAERVLQIEPDNEEFIFLYNSTLLTLKEYDELYAWLDKNAAKIKNRARLLDARGEARYRQATEGKADEALKKSGFEDFAEALKTSPDEVGVNYLYAVYLTYEKRYADALPLLKKAVALSPNAAQVRGQYWRVLFYGQPAKAEDEKKKEIADDINNFLRLRPDSYTALQTASAFYGRELEMGDEAEKLNAVILKNFPQSAAAETILIIKIETLSFTEKAKKVSDAKSRQYISMLKDFINRPQHFEDDYLGEAYAMLFDALKDDPKTIDAELLQIAENADKHQQYDAGGTYSAMAKGFAERKMFREAERFANRGFEKARRENERQREYIKDEKQLEKNLNSSNAALHHALGWTYFKENRLDEAEKELAAAIKLNGERTDFYSTLAQIYEARNDLDKAETAYINAYSTYWGKNNPNLEAIKNLYRKRHQNTEGFEAYFEQVKETERGMRKERIINAKIAAPENALPFSLKTLDGKQIALADLKGKVAVINIWGTWCGPCVMELPEFEQLHKKYADAPDVVILTINNDENAETVRKFMSGKKYDFTVLRDENYLQSVGINTFPTTWFIDRDGKISFVKVSASDKLLEEFGWRIEELRKQNGGK